MNQISTEVALFEPFNELVLTFGVPALIGSEKLEDYERFFVKIASAMKPSDTIRLMFTKDVVDWSWEIRRERIVKAETIKYYEKEIVGELIKSEFAREHPHCSELPGVNQYDNSYYRIFLAADDVEAWATDPIVRAEVNKQLAAKGFNGSYILAQVYKRAAGQIEAIDKRISFQEQRRSAALREEGIWSDRLMRQLNQARPEVVDAEFSEAGEADC